MVIGRWAGTKRKHEKLLVTITADRGNGARGDGGGDEENKEKNKETETMGILTG